MNQQEKELINKTEELKKDQKYNKNSVIKLSSLLTQMNINKRHIFISQNALQKTNKLVDQFNSY